MFRVQHTDPRSWVGIHPWTERIEAWTGSQFCRTIFFSGERLVVVGIICEWDDLGGSGYIDLELRGTSAGSENDGYPSMGSGFNLDRITTPQTNGHRFFPTWRGHNPQQYNDRFQADHGYVAPFYNIQGQRKGREHGHRMHRLMGSGVGTITTVLQLTLLLRLWDLPQLRPSANSPDSTAWSAP